MYNGRLHTEDATELGCMMARSSNLLKLRMRTPILRGVEGDLRNLDKVPEWGWRLGKVLPWAGESPAVNTGF